MLNENEKKIEAVLFFYPSPCTIKELMDKTGINKESDLYAAIDLLQQEYRERGSALEIYNKDGFVSVKLMEKYRYLAKKMLDMPFTEKQIKIIVFVMFKEPVTQTTVLDNLGSSYYDDLQELKKMKYITVKRSGRINNLYVSDKFYKLYGVDSKEKMMAIFKVDKSD